MFGAKKSREFPSSRAFALLPARSHPRAPEQAAERTEERAGEGRTGKREVQSERLQQVEENNSREDAGGKAGEVGDGASRAASTRPVRTAVGRKRSDCPNKHGQESGCINDKHVRDATKLLRVMKTAK